MRKGRRALLWGVCIEKQRRLPLLIVAACSGLAMAAIGISINCAGIFFESVSEDLGVGRGDVSLTVTLTNVLTGLMGRSSLRACSGASTSRC